MSASKELRRIRIKGRSYRTRLDLKKILSPRDWAALEVMVASGEIEDHSQLKELARRKWQRSIDIDVRGLTITRDAVALWRELDEMETRHLVAMAARAECGDDVHVEFFPEKKTVRLEHFDGRIVTIGDDQKGAA